MVTHVVTTFHFPPIPSRSHDWSAHWDGYEEDGPYGWGETEDEAKADLLENYERPDQ
ncbi:MAG: hypothetical protein ABJL57_03290 [Hyphomonas sp.]|uniref:hypothetical protein n=1 Tax=Hyphomonas sp. TaxID=87 RepID=UPI0032993AA5